jgi:hypothetical protein
MGKTKIIFLDTFIENLSSVSLYIESNGLPKTAILYKEKVFDFIEKIDFDTIDFQYCRDATRSKLGLKCIPYNKKYTIIFYQFEMEVLITEFISSKLIHW